MDGSAAGQNEIADREGCSRPPFPAKIALYPATTAPERVCFKRLNRQTGNRLKQLRVDAGTEYKSPTTPTSRLRTRNRC